MSTPSVEVHDCYNRPLLKSQQNWLLASQFQKWMMITKQKPSGRRAMQSVAGVTCVSVRLAPNGVVTDHSPNAALAGSSLAAGISKASVQIHKQHANFQGVEMDPVPHWSWSRLQLPQSARNSLKSLNVTFVCVDLCTFCSCLPVCLH